MNLSDAQMLEMLLAESYVAKADIDEAKRSKEKEQTTVERLIADGKLSKDIVGQAIAESIGVPYADLNTLEPPHDQVIRIPADEAKKFRMVLFRDRGDAIVITTDNPKKQGLKPAATKLFPDQKVTIAYSLSEDVDDVLTQYRKPLDTRFTKIIERKQHVAPELLGEIFDDALTLNASDIHFEPQEKDRVIVRFRIDGVLQEAGRLPRTQYDAVLNRIKIQGNLRIDEHLAAQDGSMRYEKGSRRVDLRVSIVPTVTGEKAVLRLLSDKSRTLSLNELGLSARDRALLESAAKKPFGMVVVTGPTGSGKTTTLYTLIRQLNKPDTNITTIEDPVEYRLGGINQIQVNPRTELTFAKGLRSIVRQDPDTILVGEIRDPETVEIAINAALTGHLLFSTFHANNAATAIPRFIDMEAESFLLASTLELVIAQRLVRKLCEQCRYSKTVRPGDLKDVFARAEEYFPSESFTLYQSKGCSVCGHTGFAGRTAIFEFIEVTPPVREVILTNPSAREVWKVARAQGSRSLFEDGIEKVKHGVTTIEELLRVAMPPDYEEKDHTTQA